MICNVYVLGWLEGLNPTFVDGERKREHEF